MSTNQLNKEEMAVILANVSLQMEGTGFGVEMLVSVMAKTKMRAASMRNIYLVTNEEMFKRIIGMDEMVDCFDPNQRVADIAEGRMGSLVGMDVYVHENVAENTFAVIVRDFNDQFVCTTMRAVN